MKFILAFLTSVSVSAPNVGQVIYKEMNKLEEGQVDIPYNEVDTNNKIEYPSLTNADAYKDTMNYLTDNADISNGYGNNEGQKKIMKNSFFLNSNYGANIDNDIKSLNLNNDEKKEQIKIESNFSLNTTDINNNTKLFISDRNTRGLYEVDYSTGKEKFNFIKGTEKKFYAPDVSDSYEYSSIASNMGFTLNGNAYRRQIVSLAVRDDDESTLNSWNSTQELTTGDINNNKFVIFDSVSYASNIFEVPNNISGVNLKSLKIRGIYSPIRSKNQGIIYIAVSYGEESDNMAIISADFNELIIKDTNDLSNYGNINFDNTNKIKYKILSNFISIGNLYQSAFFSINDDIGLFVRTSSGYKIFSSKTNFSNYKVFNDDTYVDKIFSRITTTQHNYNIDSENQTLEKDYIIFAIYDGTSSYQNGGIYYLESTDIFNSSNEKLKLNFLFKLNTKKDKIEGAALGSAGTPTLEVEVTKNLISFYDIFNEEFVIAVTTNLGIYKYIYNNVNDFASHNSFVDKVIKLNSVNTLYLNPDQNLTFDIIPNSLNFINGELVFITRKASPDKYGTPAVTGTYKSEAIYSLSKVYKKFNLKNVKSFPDLIDINLSSEQINLSQNEKINLIKEKIINEYKNMTPVNNIKYNELFKKAISYDEAQLNANDLVYDDNVFFNKDEYLIQKNIETKKYDYIIEINNDNIKKFFPENTYGDLKTSGDVDFLANDNWFSKFTNENTQKISFNYKNSFDLIEVARYFFNKYTKNNFVLDTYDKVNDIVGHIYNEIEDNLSSCFNLSNEYKGVFQKQQTLWEINDWIGGKENYPNLLDWGFNKENNTRFDQLTNRYKSKLDNIFIKIGKNNDYYNLLKLGEATEEEKNNTLIDYKNNLYIKLPPITVSYKEKVLKDRNDYKNSENKEGQLDIKSQLNKIESMQFNGKGFSIDSSAMNIEWILNSDRRLALGIGFAVSEEQIKNKLKPLDTIVEVYVYDRLFNNPVHDSGNNILENGNFYKVKVRILGLSGKIENNKWLVPLVSSLSVLMLLTVSLSIWFFVIRKKRK
ncbi:hypothetical protein [Spiroplasma tabanidicola]|uniref:Uncharacterized protein n=1 Tax=Spiroplasma tabanidicola TaxID=324079 RepID=A0A6I6C727_9MOLU|nr:hypothetical protein [Spiroplasma tabanidicola]QGS52010.1 hypothetical protein STABA_v1c06490 [Spiroplasma tabanidicola]